MLTFFKKFPEVTAVLSEKKDGSMKVFPERPDENKENRIRFFAGQGIDADRVVGAEIVHGIQAVVVSDVPVPIVLGVDALITKEKNLFLSVTVADCLPVFFYDPVAHIIGIAHAGWRGIVDGVIEKTLVALVSSGASQENLFISFGPSIGKGHFEIGTDILPRFAEWEKHIVRRDGKTFVDLPGIAKEQLQGLGISEEHIEMSTLCTFCEAETFFSYRRDKPQKIEAMVATIGLLPDSRIL